MYTGTQSSRNYVHFNSTLKIFIRNFELRSMQKIISFDLVFDKLLKSVKTILSF